MKYETRPFNYYFSAKIDQLLCEACRELRQKKQRTCINGKPYTKRIPAHRQPIAGLDDLMLVHSGEGEITLGEEY